MHHKEIEINGQRIAYYESAGKGQPVLFIHGNSMSGLAFQKQLESSLGEKYRLIAIDLPGHGRSAPAKEPKSACTLPGFADTVYEFAKGLGLDNAVLVGWSLGGHILLETIGRLPGAAGSMIFGTPPVGKPMAADAFIPHPAMPLFFKRDMSGEEADALTAACFKPGSHIPGFFYEDIMRTDGRVRESLGISIGEGNYSDEVEIAANLKTPLAVIHSSQEPFVNLDYLKRLKIPTLWRGDSQIIPDAGHTPQWERPERFNSLLDEFIADVLR